MVLLLLRFRFIVITLLVYSFFDSKVHLLDLVLLRFLFLYLIHVGLIH